MYSKLHFRPERTTNFSPRYRLAVGVYKKYSRLKAQLILSYPFRVKIHWTSIFSQGDAFALPLG
jgi:hypothetical protein